MDEKPSAELLAELDLLLNWDVAECAEDWDVIEALGRGVRAPKPLPSKTEDGP